MKLEATEQGYWIAIGKRLGRLTIAEGSTRAEALRFWCEQSGLLSLESREKIHLVEDKQAGG